MYDPAKDPVIQIEIALNFLSTLFSKVIYYKDEKYIEELHLLRRSIYYGDDFNYESIMKKLESIDLLLKQYD